MAKSTQDKLEQSLIESFESFERQIPKQRKAVLASISTARLALNERLAAKSVKGVTPKGADAQKIVDDAERLIATAYATTLRKELEQTVRASAVSTAEALIAALGPVAVLELTGLVIAMSIAELLETGLLIEFVFALIFGIALTAFVSAIVDSLMRRVESDGRNTNSRIRRFANEVSTELAKVIRQSAANGDNMADLVRKVEQVFAEADWRVRRLVDTEIMAAYRSSVARLTEGSTIVKGLRIIDFPEGHEETHDRHKCYQYAQVDEFGLGKGVYPVTVRKIRNPHPQCRSILVPVLF
jgi:hypothetical protein